MVQWLRLSAPSAGDVSLIPGQGSKISHAAPKKIYIYMRERKVSFCAWNKELNTKIFGRA